jgi:cytochrome b6-f complex iron-sulfur subunit
MSNYQVEPADKPQALTSQAIKALRHEQVQGVSRRQLLRTSIGAAFGLWLLEISAGTISFIWPNLSGGFGGKVEIGTLEDVKAQNSTLPISDGFPAYFPNARAFIVLVDPARQQFVPGTDTTGAGNSLNVRALYQRCPHLGCKPNFCTSNYWFECPCHGSRYDRLGTKVKELGPAPRSLDRFAHSIEGGVLTVDTSKITLGPLPVALGQPGLIPPRSPQGCI